MTRHLRITAAITLAGWLSATPGASPALTAEDVLRPNRDRIALCEQAMPEILRQAQLHQHNLETWIAYRRTWIEELERNAQRLSEEHDRARAVADRAVGVASSLQPLGSDRSHVPHIGWGVFGFFEQHRDRTNAAIAEAMGTVSDGTFRGHVSASGGGWITRRSLQDRIAVDEAAIQALRTSVDAGSYRIHHPVLSWVSRTSLEDCIATEERAMATTLAQIDAGEYRVHLPTLGWVTRNSLQAQIAAVRDEIAALDRRLSAGDVRIHRPVHGWLTPAGLESALDANQTAQQAARAQVASGAFRHSLPVIGFVSAEQISEIIAQRQAGIDEVRRLESTGTYSVPGPGAGYTANGAREMLARPTCRPQGPSPCITPESRAQFEDVLRRIPIAVAFDIEVRELEIRRLEIWRGALGQHLNPETERLQTERGVLTMMQGEFAEDIREMRENLQRRIAYLTDSLELLP